jgi:hypothetical protein
MLVLRRCFQQLSVGNGLWGVRFQVPTVRAPERSDWNDFISFLHLKTRPETRLGFPWRPVLSLQSTVGVIRHPTGLHVGVTPYALDRAFHIHLQRKA